MRRWLAGLLVALGLAGALAAAANLRPLWRSFDTVPVPAAAPAAADSPAARLDAVLREHLRHLRHAPALRRGFGGGERSVRLAGPIWFDRCETRQGDFYKFARWRPFQQAETQPPSNPPLGTAPIGAGVLPPDWRHYSSSRDHAISGRLDAPASGVAWFDAYAYCRAAGGRLPTVDEWRAAATGRGHRLYPWGDVFDGGPWPHLDPLLNAARKCAATPSTDTPLGISDLGQNVAEWAAGGGRDAPVLGGNAYNSPYELHSLGLAQRRAPKRFRSPYVGFRCVYDRQPPAETPWRAAREAVPLPAGEYAVGAPAGARLPSLVAHLPPERFDLIEGLFAARDAAPGATHLTRREITRREYAAFLSDPFVLAGFHADQNQPERHSHRPPDWDSQRRHPELPVVNVDWWSAYAFAAWAGGRLPTAEEWASAASGQGRRLYPWGNHFAAANPVTGERALGGPMRPAPADGDITPEGLLAMGGNVSEWTRSVSTASGAFAVIVKGGNYLLPGAATARLDHASHVSPNHRAPTLGFRVAFDRARRR